MENVESKPLGVIDALAAGFELVVRHPWVLLLPIALDLFLWLGPQARAKPVFDQVIQVLAESAVQSNAPDAQSSFELLRGALQAAGDQFNIFSYIALFGIGIPTVTGLDMPKGLAAPVAFSIADEVTLLAWIVLCALIGLLLGSIYLEWIARPVRHEAGGARTFLPRLVKAYATVLWLAVLVVGGALLLSVPFVVSAVLVSFLSPGLAFVLLLVIWLILIWLAMYLAFAIPAVFVSGSGAAQAILNSIAVFRYSFWSAVGLIFLIVLVEMGFSVIWQQLVVNAWGVVVVILASAFLGTGLIAGGMLFYHDRFTWLTQVRQRIRQHPRPLIKG